MEGGGGVIRGYSAPAAAAAAAPKTRIKLVSKLNSGLFWEKKEVQGQVSLVSKLNWRSPGELR